jgi:uncharacterized protein YjcR
MTEAPTEARGRNRIDWVKARARYLELGSRRTFVQIASEFGISDTAVRKHARLNGWKEAALAFDRKDSANLERQALRNREARNARFIEIVAGAVLEWDHTLSERIKKMSAQDLVALLRHAELIEGEATERIERLQVMVCVGAIYAAVGDLIIRRVPPEERAAELALIDQAVAAIGSGEEQAA